MEYSNLLFFFQVKYNNCYIYSWSWIFCLLEFFVLLYLFMILNFFLDMQVFLHRSICKFFYIARYASWFTSRAICKLIHIAHSLRSCLRPSRPSLSVVLRRLADPFGEKNFFVNRFKVWSDIFWIFFIFLVMCFCYIYILKKIFF